MKNDERLVVIGMTTTYDQCRTFLERLARESDFRDDVRSQPREVLREYGIVISELPEEVHLASEDEIEGFLSYLDERKQLGGPQPQVLGYAVLWHAFAAYAMPVVAGAEHELDRAG